MPAPKSVPTTTPARISVRSGSRSPTRLAIETTSATAAMPPAKAHACVAAAGSAKQHRHARAQRAARGDAEDVGRDERIAKEALEGRAGAGERRAHGEGGQHARRTHLDHHRIRVARCRRTAVHERRPQRAPHLGRRDRETPYGEAPCRERQERGGGRAEREAEARRRQPHRGTASVSSASTMTPASPRGVTGQSCDALPERAALERLDQRADRGRLDLLRAAGEVVALAAHGHEAEAVLFGGRLHPEAGVGLAARDERGHGAVGDLLGVVALQARAVQPFRGDQELQQRARAGAALAVAPSARRSARDRAPSGCPWDCRRAR